MARARNIKPGLCKNEDLAECSIWARHLFACLPMWADREGRLEDRPKRLKMEIFPADNVDVDVLLTELTSHGTPPFLVRYQNSDGSFIQISRFSAHQTPHYSEKSSVIKPPELQELQPDDEAQTPRTLQENTRKDTGIKRGSKPPDSLIPSSLIPDSLIPEKSKSASQGSRLPPDWVLPDEWGDWAMTEENWGAEKLLSVAERFKDHWLAKAGKEARKVDWLATWRMWVRKEREFSKGNGSQPPEQPKPVCALCHKPILTSDRVTTSSGTMHPACYEGRP